MPLWTISTGEDATAGAAGADDESGGEGTEWGDDWVSDRAETECGGADGVGGNRTEVADGEETDGGGRVSGGIRATECAAEETTKRSDARDRGAGAGGRGSDH